MPHCSIDHLVITAPTLESGAEFVRQTLGVAMQQGGEHQRMGTHNLLLRLGDAIYLEVIAPNPNAPAPGRPRWFSLDDLKADTPPRLATWVARTEKIQARATACSEPLGNIETMSRGLLQWLITIPEDGCLKLEGIAPALIEWHTEKHPASSLQEVGLSLVELQAFHPEPRRIEAMLQSIGFEGPLSVSPIAAGEAPHLVAKIKTPSGFRQLSVPQAREDINLRVR